MKAQKPKEGCSQFSVLCASKCGTFIVGWCILESQVKNWAVIFELLSNFLLQVFEWAQEKENLFPPQSGFGWMRLTGDFKTFKQLFHLVLIPDNFQEDGWFWVCTLGTGTLLWGKYIFWGRRWCWKCLDSSLVAEEKSHEPSGVTEICVKTRLISQGLCLLGEVVAAFMSCTSPYFKTAERKRVI